MGNSLTSQPQLRSRIQELEQQVSMLREREATKEEEWRRERRRMKKKASEDEECAEWRHWMGTECFVEHLKEEQKQREVAVEKWKHLYLTIKNELADLIVTTKSQGGRIAGGGEEGGVIERLRAEIMGKEATIEALRSRLSRMEEAGARREREIDILKQSVRILNNGKKKGGVRRRLQRRWL